MLRLAENEAGWTLQLQRDYDPSIPEFAGDADRLTQALLNLVRNAIQAGATRIVLPEDLAEHLFLPLVSGRAEGTGLGLALAQQVAREHRGTLSFRSRPGHTVFTLLLPLPVAGEEKEPTDA